jgi:phospholipase C
MECYPAKCVPVISTLARELAVCSRWFCSLPSETWPNRLFVHSGTSHGSLEREELIEDEPTIFKRLDDEGRDSRVYAGDLPQALTYFWQVRSRWLHMSQFDATFNVGDCPHTHSSSRGTSIHRLASATASIQSRPSMA